MAHFDATQGSAPSPQAQAAVIGNQGPVAQASAVTDGPVLDNPHEVGDFSQDPIGPLKAALAEPEVLDHIATILASQMAPPPLDQLEAFAQAMQGQGGQPQGAQAPQAPQAPGVTAPSSPPPTAGANPANSFTQVPFAGQPATGPLGKILGGQ